MKEMVVACRLEGTWVIILDVSLMKQIYNVQGPKGKVLFTLPNQLPDIRLQNVFAKRALLSLMKS